MRKILLALLFLLFAAVRVDAATRYAATTGSGSSCLIASPCSLNTAINGAQIGDTILLRAGTYSQSIDPTPLLGSAGTVTWIGRYQSENVIIKPPAGSAAIAGLYNAPTAAYITFDGLDFDGSNNGSSSNITASSLWLSHHITFQNCKIHHWTNSGLQLFANNITVQDCEIHHNGVSVINGTTQDHGVYVSGNDIVVRRTDFHHNLGFDVHHYDSGDSSVLRAVIDSNTIHDCGGGSHGLPDVGGPIILYHGTSGTVVKNNVIYNCPNSNAIQTGNGTIGAKFWNNTVYNSGGFAYDLLAGSGHEFKNNIHFGAGSSINPGPGLTQSHNSCVSGCTGTGALNGVDPLFVNPGAVDFRLLATSPMINAGIDVGLPCNGGCAIGAFDPPVLTQVAVGPVANKITLTFDNDAGQPLRTTTTFSAGWSALKTAVNNPIISAALIGNAVIELTTQNNFLSTDGCLVSYVQASGGLSDSVLIGGSLNQAFHSRTSVPCTNNVPGGGGSTPVLTQLSYRVRELYGSETAAGWKAAENTPYDVVVAGAARVRIKTKAETAAPAAFNLGAQKRITLPGGSAGAKTRLIDTCSATELACFFGLGTALGVANNTTTTEQLTSTLANANCLVLLQNSTPNMQPGINTEWECEIAIKLDPSLPPGSKVEIFMTRDGGAEFESYPANSIATLNIVDNQFIDGG